MTPTQPPGLRADEREALKPCPFCGGRPILTVRPDNANATAYFAAVACFCGGYASCAHKDAIAIEPADAEAKAIAAWNARAALTTQPATSEEREGLVQRLRKEARHMREFKSFEPVRLLTEAADALAQPAAPVAVPEGEYSDDPKQLQVELHSMCLNFNAMLEDRNHWKAKALAASQPPVSEPANRPGDARRDRMMQTEEGRAALNAGRERLGLPPLAELTSEPAAQQAAEGEPSKVMRWEGAEEWMPLAWELCAEECGEEACTELVWEGGPIPEPWGDRWLKYEDEAKRLIALVRKCVPATPATQPAEPSPSDAELDSSTAAERDELLDFIYEHGTVSEGVRRLIRKVQRATLAKFGGGR